MAAVGIGTIVSKVKCLHDENVDYGSSCPNVASKENEVVKNGA